MTVDYNSFAKTFAKSRENMKWPELEYFFSCSSEEGAILDIGCGSGRFLAAYRDYFGDLPKKYLGIDLSSELLIEARKSFPKNDFVAGDMRDICKIIPGEIYESIFCIASFHHLETLDERIKFLKDLKNILNSRGKIYMTNWSLSSSLNYEKYKNSIITGSKNRFNSRDYSIKIGKSQRYYHDFSLEELGFLALESGLQITESRLFETQRNIITVFQK